jgi:SAM-dependent methyltransferase
VRLALSRIEQGRTTKGSLRALDAGCGRGAGVIGNAVLQPDVQFTGLDMNRVAMAEAQQMAAQEGATNVKFTEADLMHGESMGAPGSFDVIFSSGVIHHLSDPLTGLRNLTRLLAPHGVMLIMVYAAYGREPLHRVQQALKLLGAGSHDFAQGIALGRDLTQDAAAQGVFRSTPWETTHQSGDVEFVDRCLNVNETSYTLDAFWDLLTQANLRFVQWAEPMDWSVARVLPEGPLRDQALGLPEKDQYKLLELLRWRPSFECVVTHTSNTPRRRLTLEQIPTTSFRVNPEASFWLETRNLKEAQRFERVSYKVRAQEAVPVSNKPMAKALMILKDQTQAFTGDSWLRVLGAEGVSKNEAAAMLMYYVENDVVYRPHANDV